MEDFETTDVVICGCGPTGAMLSILLGQQGVSNIVLERDAEVNTDPRGIALDEDGLRYLQACGVYDKIFTEIGHTPHQFEFISGAHQDLNKKPFFTLEQSTSEGGTGHPGMFCHKQPAIERNLRAQIDKLPASSLRVESTLTSIDEDASWVYITYTNSSSSSSSSPTPTSHRLRAKFLVGADGKTGFVRKNYLEPKGISMNMVSEIAYNETWVALNWHITLPTPETHPNFPLWSKGFTPEQVYDAFFPSNFRFLRNPKRAAVCGRFGLTCDRLWRFEFVVLPDEDEDEMASDKTIFDEVVGPYLRHDAGRYGILEGGGGRGGAKIEFPRDCIRVLRCRPFRFAARSCDRWSLGRTVLCGDAAHVFPPFGGQGIASGFRDAISVAWRLALATGKEKEGGRTAVNHEKLLEGWYTERKQQLDRSLALTVANGNQVKAAMGASPWAEMGREWFLWAVQLLPSWSWWGRRKRRNGMTAYEWVEGRGMAFVAPSTISSPSSPNPVGGDGGGGDGGDGEGWRGGMVAGGKNFPQVYCRELLRVASAAASGARSGSCSSAGTSDDGDIEGGGEGEGEATTAGVGPVQFTDDAIFSRPSKLGLFQMVVLAPTVDHVPELRGKLDGLATASGGMIDERDATFFVGDTTALLPAQENKSQSRQPDENKQGQHGRIYRLATAQEFASSQLCRGRPYPQYYDEKRMSADVEEMPFVILRPDRFIYTACGRRDQLIKAAEALRQLRLG